MDWLLVPAGGGFGLLIGSFIGAAALRLPRGEGVVTGRSHCDGCGRALGVVDLVPVVSFLALRGKCRSCGQPIDRLQPLAELGGALVGALSVWAGETWWQAGLLAVFGWQLLLLALLDADHFWLPRGLVALLAATAALALVPAGPALAEFALQKLAGGALGFVLLAAPAIAYRALRKREGMGSADPWLLAAIGLWLGIEGVVVTLLIAAGLGLLLAIVLRLSGRETSGQTALPLGTLLAVAAYPVALAGGPGTGLG